MRDSFDSYENDSSFTLNSGQYLIVATLGAPPQAGEGKLFVDSDFTFDVDNITGILPVTLWGQIGVSNPSQGTYPMYPYVGVLHPKQQVTVLPGSRISVHVTRLDVVDPQLLSFNDPHDINHWFLVPTANGHLPALAATLQSVAGSAVTIANVSFKTVAKVPVS